MTGKIDVFVSRKSQDEPLAKELSDFLVNKGLSVFEASKSLPEMGDSEYQKAIDDALDACTHLILVGSSIENLSSPWVESEWRSYINYKRRGRKKGNLVTVVGGGLADR